MPQPFGRRETRDGATFLVLDVDLAHPRDQVWRTVATARGLEPWLGLLEGDVASGRTVTLRMTAEGEDAPAEPLEIRRCEAPVSYDVVAGVGGESWRLGVTIVETPEGCTLTLTHRFDESAGFDMYGPGWEYYLHRLRAHLDGEALETVNFDDYLPNAGFYAELFGIEPSTAPARSTDDTLAG